MRVTVERAALLRSLGHVHRVVERRNTIPILSNVLLRADGDGLQLQGDRPRHRGDRDACRPRSREPGATTVPAHMLYDIVRKLPDGAQVSLETTGDAGQMHDPLRPLALHAAGACPRATFPDLAAGELPHRFAIAGGRPQAADREDPVRDLDRGDALLPQRHLPPHHRGRRASRCCAPSPPTATASPGSRSPAPDGREGHAGHHRAAQGRGRDPEARRGRRRRASRIELSAAKIRFTLRRRRRADLEADRRHLPRLPARHPDRERQAPHGRARRVRRAPSTASRRSRPSAAAP